MYYLIKKQMLNFTSFEDYNIPQSKDEGPGVSIELVMGVFGLLIVGACVCKILLSGNNGPETRSINNSRSNEITIDV
jgi:hypothetical protein